MKLKDQVTSLELSKKLKELGAEQKSLWYWDNHEGLDQGFILTQEAETEEFYSAFTVAELGEMLKEYALDYWYSYPDFRLKVQIGWLIWG